jgi:hypothetical protein
MTLSDKRTIGIIVATLVCVSLLTVLIPSTLWMTVAIWMLSPRYLDGQTILQLSGQWTAIIALSFGLFRSSSFLFWKSRGF